MSQLQLLTVPPPALPEGIDLRCGDVAEIIAETRGAALVMADPPWCYDQRPGAANPDEHYDVLSMVQIATTLANAHTSAAKGARLALWTTWPTLGEFLREQYTRADWPWRDMLTGGAWHKQGGCGVGFHWRGRTEPLIVYKTGSPYIDRAQHLINGHVCPQTEHSGKPVEWLRGMLRRWTQPGDLVLDLYAGLAPMARACALEGRRYVGSEIDPGRHRQAVDRLALWGRE